MSKQLVLVTGVTGFIAGQVAQSFVDAGYRVRGTVRSGKRDQVTPTEDIEFVQIDDISTADFTEALKGVYAVIHVASPLAGRASAEETLNAAVDGTLNVLTQAEKLGITKFVVTASSADCIDYTKSATPGFANLNFTEKDWGVTSREVAIANAANAFFVYSASKTLAEKAVWEFAKHHPHVDVATVLPGFVFGPYAKGYPYPSDPKVLGTMAWPFALINGGTLPVVPPWITDVRDVAKAHVLALSLPPVAPGTNLEDKRFLINGGNYTWKEAAIHLKKVLSVELAERLTDPASIADLPGIPSTLDTTRAKAVLGLEFISPEKTLEDAVVAVAQVQKTWAQVA
ncbi:NAD(P)-binding protein [Coprinopsis marcescibilis]|uniref:NAD(P)-binding protein n=1 Tax=Coprinopsis marcescibilis TaxID=230819 RepID=A0A5C3L2A7_COPMA|nr:NAD(P)-binding protein [Coprinopsis marcescibilis]